MTFEEFREKYELEYDKGNVAVTVCSDIGVYPKYDVIVPINEAWTNDDIRKVIIGEWMVQEWELLVLGLMDEYGIVEYPVCWCN